MARTDKTRILAIELAARFAQIGEEPAISVARAEMILDFISSGQSLPGACRSIAATDQTRPRRP